MTIRSELAFASSAWPYKEARKLLERYSSAPPTAGHVLFETGYGPSGLPHVGTFAEVLRTTMIVHAFGELSDLGTKLICFSDDMDGMRKIPDNVPNHDLLAEHLGKPLTAVPDPFGTHSSFGEHNNSRLRAFLDRFGFEYDFYSSTECYRSGLFDDTLLAILRLYEPIRSVVLPTLGEERRKTYSPFLPLCPKSGVVLQTPILGTDPEAGTITFDDCDGETHTVPVTGGRVKCQWKVDWAMRWQALGVDYEMSGKDLMESVKLSTAIQRILGGRPPEGLTYELFLDEQGRKISKSIGNGLTIEEWLSYANPESLSWYMFQSPRRAKRLFFDIIPKAVDDYFEALARYPEEDPASKLVNPVHHVHGGDPPTAEMPLSFGLILNLVSAAHIENKEALWGLVQRYTPDVGPDTHPDLDRLLDHALRYYTDFVAPNQSYRAPLEHESAAMLGLVDRLQALPTSATAEQIQTEVYEAGKVEGFDSLRDWFRALYECLLGHSQGPRMGSFIELYGISETVALIEEAVQRAATAESG
jgi:lysyl-tRNA synthetase class 1